MNSLNFEFAMQLYALNDQGKPIFVNHALKQHDYFCLECNQRLRIREGRQRHIHFYHIEPNRHCHQSGKTLTHLQVQSYFLFHLSQCQLERRFPQIGRIADVAWETYKIIFEIQCSFISAAELLQRNKDYQQIGWQVIWILHDQRYNRSYLTAAEEALQQWPHYFTNINAQGNGVIYDQFERSERGRRIYKSEPFPLEVEIIRSLTSALIQSHFSFYIKERLSHWPYAFKGDIVDLSLENRFDNIAIVKGLLPQKIQQFKLKNYLEKAKALCMQYLVRPFRLILQMLLEKMCQ